MYQGSDTTDRLVQLHFVRSHLESFDARFLLDFVHSLKGRREHHHLHRSVNMSAVPRIGGACTG